MERIRNIKIREEVLDREASLQRARREASLVDGVSWGMGEDAIEEAEVYKLYCHFVLEHDFTYHCSLSFPNPRHYLLLVS